VRTLVIVNTRCCGGDVNLYDYLRTLAPSSAEVVVRYLQGAATFDDLLSDASGFDRVVAVGGDGTVSAVC